MSTEPPAKVNATQNLLAVAQTIQFAWFVGHVITLVSALLYLFTYRAGSSANDVFYRLVFLGALESFTIIIYQNLSVLKTAKDFIAAENVQYAFLAAVWFYAPKHFLAIFPFAIFSLFHVLTYTKSVLLPAAGIVSPISQQIDVFVRDYNDKCILAAANDEFILLVWVILRAIACRRKSWIVLICYGLFSKLRHEKSVFFKSVVRQCEVRIDGVVASQSVPPQVKQSWVQFKELVKKFGAVSLTEVPEKTQ